MQYDYGMLGQAAVFQRSLCRLMAGNMHMGKAKGSETWTANSYRLSLCAQRSNAVSIGTCFPACVKMAMISGCMPASKSLLYEASGLLGHVLES